MPFDAAWTEQRANVEKLARALEESETFDLAHVNHRCGTPACIKGHANALWPGLSEDDDCLEFSVKIGVPRAKIDMLCFHWTQCTPFVPSFRVTGRMAAAALRRLADTGEAYFSLDDA